MSSTSSKPDFPCHALPKDQWCDRHGPGGFMGHTCDTPKPLPEPFRTPLPAGTFTKLLAVMDEYAAAHAAAVTAAARDCRLCRNFYVPHETCIEDASCTNGDRYEPLPPVRLWRTAP